MTTLDHRPIDFNGFVPPEVATDPLAAWAAASRDDELDRYHDWYATRYPAPDYHPAEDDDPYATPCLQPACTHDRGSHWDATGDCGWCACTQFRSPAVLDQDNPAAFQALVAAYLPDDQPPY